MSLKNRPPNTGTVLLTISCIILYGCGSPPASTSEQSIQVRNDPSGTAGAPATIFIDARPVALVDGQTVAWDDLRPTLSELAGGEALWEVVLDQVIARELEQTGLRISEDDIARERKLLVENLSDDLNISIRLLNELRVRQRLGSTRFEGLLRRNASLRALVQKEVMITDAALRHTYDLLYGEKRQIRLLTTPSLGEAESALKRLEDGEHFADVAVELSTDSSAARGGLLEPISENDPAYPAALRKTIWDLQPGEISAAVLIRNQYAIMQSVRTIDAQDKDFEESRSELERLTRLSQERLLMERRARLLLGNVSITFFDESIEEGFRAMRRNSASLINP